MKKIILLLLICLSQPILAQKSFFGVNAGINVANQRQHYTFTSSITGTTYQEVTYFMMNSIKPSFGIFYHYGVNEKMGLRLNVQYMGLGCDFKEPGPSDNLSINYLTLPLTFHYMVNPHLSFNAGPYLSFVLSGTKINNEEITKTYHKNDAGFSFGGEHDLYKNIAISVNYIFGLKNIWLDDTSTAAGTTTHINYTNRALQVTLIYKFKTKA